MRQKAPQAVERISTIPLLATKGMLSIVIVNWNTRDLLLACLQSIHANPSAEPMETIVVDNNSADGSADAVESQFPNVRLIRSDSNLGYAAGNNLGFAAATGNAILTLNPDTEVRTATLDVALSLLREHPTVGVVGVKQVEPSGRVQLSVRGFPSFKGIVGDITGLGKRNPGSVWDSYRLTSFNYELEQECPQPMGTFNLFRREALAAIGNPGAPFDTQFPIFFNEVDLIYRLRLAGWKCLYTPRAEVLHHGGESTKQVRKSMVWESHLSLIRYLRKHSKPGLGRIGAEFISLIVWIGALVRARGFSAGFRP